jgi:hypothetical protein
MDRTGNTTRFRARLHEALVVLFAAIPALALAQGPNFGGGHGSSGGGHASAPLWAGGHASAPPHFAAAPHFSAAPHFAAAPHFETPHYSTPAAHYSAPVSHAAYGGYPVHTGAYMGAPRYAPNHAVPTHPGYGQPAGPGYGGAHLAPGRYVPGYGFHYGHWHGGYWHGGYWPAVYWGGAFAWWVPAVPAFCAVYWWNSIPYYYYNNVYYTYDPSANGYVVTTPPPSDGSAEGDGAAASAPDASAAPPPGYANSDAEAANGPAPADPPDSSGHISGLYAYPKNGQSDEQQSSDRQECAQWASNQTASDGTGTAEDYQRALTACLQGRGYSVN